MDNVLYSPSGNVSLQISEDKMSAWMVIRKTDQMIGEREILDLIDHSGICYGFEDALSWISEHGFTKDFDKPFPIALCKAAASATKQEVHFDTRNTYSPYQDWSFDDVKNWTFVKQGAILTELAVNLFTDGGSVYNIFGELTTQITEAKDGHHLAGENVTWYPETGSLVADVTGYPYQDKDGKINVTDSLIYNGSIRNSTDPITLACKLIVNGSISNSSITVKSDITVNGDVEASQIYSEGNLFVTGKITSCQPGGITVYGDLKVQSILTSIIVCKGVLSFDYGITGSRVIAESGVKGHFDHSSVVGSSLQTSVSIDIASAGNNDGIDTELEVSISPFLKERMTQLTKTLVRLKNDFDANADLIEDANSELMTLEKQLAEDMSNFLMHKVDTDRYIIIHRDIYPGVYIRILKRSLTVKTYQTYSEYREYENQ